MYILLHGDGEAAHKAVCTTKLNETSLQSL